MDIAYNGIWGYTPLILTLAGANEVLYLVNRPGSRPSSDGAAAWLDHAIDLVAPGFQRVRLRCDTDFALTSNLDRQDERVGFVFGYDAKENLVDMAEALRESQWQPLERPPRYEVKTEAQEGLAAFRAASLVAYLAPAPSLQLLIKCDTQTWEANPAPHWYRTWNALFWERFLGTPAPYCSETFIDDRRIAPDKNDRIITCSAEGPVYQALLKAKTAIQQLQ